MTGALYRLGRFCARHHWPVLALWLVGAVAVAVVGFGVGANNNNDLTLPGAQSTRAQDLLERHLPAEAHGTNPILLRAERGKVTDQRNSAAIDRTVKELRARPEVRSAISPLSRLGAAQVSRDERIAYISVVLRESPSDLTMDEAQRVFDATAPASDAGIEVAAGGYLGETLSQTDTDSSEAIGLAAAIVILLFAFGTVTAMALPIVTAVVGLVTTLALLKLLSHVTDVPSVAPTLATMIGLGVGIDYALFLVTRHRQQLREGIEMLDSIGRATGTAGGAVVFAGSTVVVALCSLVVSGIPLVGAMGCGAAVAVVVAVIAAITLLPALLGALGPRIDSLRVKLGRTHPDDRQPHGWRRWANAVTARPWRSLLAGGFVLLAIAIPTLDLELGSSDDGELPAGTTARTAYDLMAEGFGPGANGPLLIGVRLGSPAQPAQDPSADPRLAGLAEAIRKTDGIAAVSPPTVDRRRTVAVLTALAKTAPSDPETGDLVEHLRTDVVPKAVKGKDMEVFSGGETAAYIDLAARISDKLPQMIALVVALSFVLLLLAFRSLLLPVKAAVANLLSVGAAYGVVTFVFQEGHGAGLLGLDGPTPIASYVPLLMFTILFGLSMDYEVFLLSQIQEHFLETGDTRRAIVDGLANTGRVITSAALIMVCVFASFVLSDDAVVKQFGLGLSVAIAIDATIVRCLLVPAAMRLLGDRCWWLPRWLDRILPRVSIEGGASLDRAAARANANAVERV